jgi:transposase
LTGADRGEQKAALDKPWFVFSSEQEEKRMAQKGSSMRKIREILRLHYELGLLQQEIARGCGISQPTVHRYLERAQAAGLSWPLPQDYDDRQLNQLFTRAVVRRDAPEPPAHETETAPPLSPEPARRRAPINFDEIHRELQTHKHLTLQLLWEEYLQSCPDGYRYSQFCELYRQWRRKLDVVLRQDHRAGEKMFVDWAGDTVPIYDRDTGEAHPAYLFVAVLGASSYTFAHAAPSQQLPHWIACHIQALEFFAGVPQLIVPDNPKTAVTRACRYDPDLNRTYLEFAEHYHVAVLPARPYKARDKAKVEVGVLVAERWLLAVLRHEKFFSLPDLNHALAPLLDRLNQRPFRKREGCRISLYATLDRPALQPLPLERYVMAEFKTVRVNIDYHVEVDDHYYSVPYQLRGEQVEARLTPTTVEILYRGHRVASHVRSSVAHHHTTVHEHMPKSHQAYLEWTPSRLIHWGDSVGPATAQVIATILESKPHPEQGYRACLGILRLGKTYSTGRLEAACQRALHSQACSYHSLQSILQQGLDRQTLASTEAERSSPRHENLRGATYYDPPNNNLVH